MSYEDEEQFIIDDETLTEAERKAALRDLYRSGIENIESYPDEQF
ncbi:MAG: hypothetical protein ACUZ9M_00835 [Candidatus Scalindua sp.]